MMSMATDNPPPLVDQRFGAMGGMGIPPPPGATMAGGGGDMYAAFPGLNPNHNAYVYSLLRERGRWH